MRGEGDENKEYMYMYDWVIFLYSRNWHNIVNQLHNIVKQTKNNVRLIKTTEMNLRNIHLCRTEEKPPD